MIRRIRHLIAPLAASIAITAAFVAGTPGTAAASTPVCATWKIPSGFHLHQGNGWDIYSYRALGNYKWYVSGYHPGGQAVYGTLSLTRFDVSGPRPLVRFTIMWTNLSAGVYEGTIDRDGFLTGTTSDRFHPGVTSTFQQQSLVDCAP